MLSSRPDKATAAMVACTRSRQPDQTAFQQEALTGLMIKKQKQKTRHEGWRGTATGQYNED